jgi:hypothetical protein
MCSTHYHQALKAGTITKRPARTEEERFWAFVSPEPNTGCFLWTGALNAQGYGVFTRADGRDEGAHRFALELALGRPLQPGEWACHGCDFPACVRVGPGHIFPGTPTDNVRDMMAKGRQVVVLPNLRGSKHPNAKLTEDDVREIRRRRATGESFASLAEAFGIANRNIQAVVYRRSWRHVP